MTIDPPARPTIVLVDDDAAVAHSLEFALELDGFEVRTYSTAEALLSSEAFPERGCLVLDVNLPGMNGLELLRSLRARRVVLPAVLITTNPNAALRARAAAARVPIIEKPLLADTLPEAVRGMLQAAGA